MAITIKSRDVTNYNAIAADGGPKKDQYLDHVDENGVTVATLTVPADGSTPTFAVDEDDVVTVKKKTVTLTDAQIKALPTTAINILPAPGAGILNHVHGALFVADFTAGAYTNLSANPFFNIVYDAANNYINATLLAGEEMFLAGHNVCYTLPYMLLFEGATQPSAFPRSSAEFGETINRTVDIGGGNVSSGNFTGGHADNTLKVTVFYTPITV
jgi:hypothetical protein